MYNPSEPSSADTIYIEDETLRAGFAQVPNRILRMKGLSHGARLTYALLLSYAWQKGSCFPGQERLAEDLDVSRQSISTYLRELKTKGLIIVKRRGLGQTNVYIIPRLPDSPESGPGSFPAHKADAKPTNHPDVNQVLHPNVNVPFVLDGKQNRHPDANPGYHLDVKPVVQKEETENKSSKKKIQHNKTRKPVVAEQEMGTVMDAEKNAIAQELIAFGIAPLTAVEFASRYPRSYIKQKYDYVKFLVSQKSALIRRNPAGYLRKAIEEDYTAPAGYDRQISTPHLIPNAGSPTALPHSDDNKAAQLEIFEQTEIPVASETPAHAISDEDAKLSKQLDELLASDQSLAGMPYIVYFKDCLVRRNGSRATVLLRHAFAAREARSHYRQRCLYLLRRIDPTISDLDFETA